MACVPMTRSSSSAVISLCRSCWALLSQFVQPVRDIVARRIHGDEARRILAGKGLNRRLGEEYKGIFSHQSLQRCLRRQIVQRPLHPIAAVYRGDIKG